MSITANDSVAIRDRIIAIIIIIVNVVVVIVVVVFVVVVVIVVVVVVVVIIVTIDVPLNANLAFPNICLGIFLELEFFLCDAAATTTTTGAAFLVAVVLVAVVVVLVVVVVVVLLVAVVNGISFLAENVVPITLVPFARNLFVLLEDDAFVMILRQKSDSAIQLAITGGI